MAIKRRAAGLTAAALATKAGYARSTIASAETDPYRRTSRKLWNRLSEVLGCDPAEIEPDPTELAPSVSPLMSEDDLLQLVDAELDAGTVDDLRETRDGPMAAEILAEGASLAQSSTAD